MTKMISLKKCYSDLLVRYNEIKNKKRKRPPMFCKYIIVKTKIKKRSLRADGRLV